MATQPIAPPMTVEEFLSAYTDDDRVELIDGEVWEHEGSGFRHDNVKNNLKDLFEQAGIRSYGFRCMVETSFQMRRINAVTPDVSIIRLERLIGVTGNSPMEGAPDIAIEVSISDRSSVLDKKVAAYLGNGAHAVCIVYPESKSVTVYSARVWRRLSEGDTLEFSELLPGLQIAVSSIFALDYQ